MASTPTTRNRFNLQGTGDNSGTWGSTLNSQVFDLVDTSLDGFVSVAVAGNVTLSSTNYVDDEARNRVLKFTGAGGFNVIVPGVEKWYIVHNACTAAVVVKTSGGTGATINPATITPVYCDGTDCAQATNMWPFSDGTAAAPGAYFSSDTNTGFYRIGADNIGLSLGGTKRVDFATAGTTVTGTFSATGTGSIGGALTAASASFTTTVSIGTTLGVTGGTTLAALSATTGTFSGAVNMAALTATTGAFSSTLGATGVVTFNSTLSVAGTATLNGLAVTTSATVGTTLAVTGATTMAALSATTGAFTGAVSGLSYSMAQGGMTTSGANGYTRLTDGTGTNTLFLGGTGDPSNIYDNTTHLFRARSAGATFASLTSTGLAVTGIGAFSSGITATSGAFSANVTVGTTLGVTGVATLASGTATPAGGSAAARHLFGTTANFGIYYGSGAPTVTAAKGSLYLRSDGSSTTTRMYVNNDGATGWSALVTAD